jgi:hypothetical protein
MNEEEEEALLEDSRKCQNRLARDRHAARFEEQHATNANRRATHRAARSDAQITTDANSRAVQRTVRNDAQNAMNARWRVVQRTTHNDAQIALENVVHVNARTLLHSDKQQEMHNADPQAH